MAIRHNTALIRKETSRLIDFLIQVLTSWESNIDDSEIIQMVSTESAK
jgi:hypothetical protein